MVTEWMRRQEQQRLPVALQRMSQSRPTGCREWKAYRRAEGELGLPLRHKRRRGVAAVPDVPEEAHLTIPTLRRW